MNKFIFGLAVFFTTFALAGTDPSDTFRLGNGSPSTDKKIIINQGTAPYPAIKWNNSSGTLQFTNDGTNFSDLGSGSGSGQGFNVLTNADFESGVVLGFTHSGGTLTAATSGSNLLLGKGSAVFTASGTGNTFSSTTYTIPNGLKGAACNVSTLYLGGSANLKLQAFDGTNILASADLPPVTSPTTVSAPFQCPSSGTFQWRVIASGAAPATSFDTAFLGQNVIVQVSQSNYVGGVVSAGCNLFNVATVAMGDLAAGSCTGTPVGQASSFAAGSNGAITFNSLEPGEYYAVWTAFCSSSTATNFATQLEDDVGAVSSQFSIGTSSGINAPCTFVLHATYTSAGPHTFKLQGYQGSGPSSASVIMNPGGASANEFFSLYRFPTQSQLAVKPETINWYAELSFAALSTNFVMNSTTVSSPPQPMVGAASSGLATISSGTVPALPTCNGTSNPPTDGNCSNAATNYGISFYQPAAGLDEVCWNFGHFRSVNPGGTVSSNFVTVETPIGDNSTILQQAPNFSADSQDINATEQGQDIVTPFRYCSFINFTTAGQKALRLYYTQGIVGSITNNSVIIEGGFYFPSVTVRPITQNVPAPVLTFQPVAFHVSGIPSGAPGNSAAATAIFPKTGPLDFDTHAGYSTITGFYRVPVAGLWQFTCQLYIDSATTVSQGWQYDAYLCKNSNFDCTTGNIVSLAQQWFTGNVAANIPGDPINTALVNMNVGDTMNCGGELNADAQWAAGSYVNTWFEGHLVR